MKRILTFLAFFALTAMAAAQQTNQPKPAGKQGAALFASAQQSPEMKKMIESFAGIWKTTVHAVKGEWFPADGDAKGRAEIHAGPAGNSIMEQFHSNGPLGNFAGHGVYWYDKEGGGYRGLWCDSMDPRGCGPVGKGGWEGDNLIFNNEIDMGNAKMKVRETFSNITKDSYDFMIEASMGEAPMTKMMSIRYERAVPKSGTEKK